MSYPLFTTWPKLKSTLHIEEFADLPTPVEQFNFSHKNSTPIDNLWIKRDDLTHSLYGGNKVRKLEFIIGDAKSQNKNTLVTMGAIGTNHGTATAIFADIHGLNTEVILFDQPVTKTVINNLRIMNHYGAKLKYKKTILASALSYYASSYCASIFSKQKKYHLPAGGSNTIGCISFVNAALELNQQIDDGALPKPDMIICPVGSSGTLAGLTLGMALLKSDIQVIGVRVAPSHLGPIPICTKSSVTSLMNQTYKSLKEKDSSIPNVSLPEIILEDDYYGDGYGVALDAGDKATQVFSDAGLTLESTYTAKAAAATLDLCQAFPDKKILYWHTFNSRELDLGEPSEDLNEEWVNAVLGR